MGAAPVASLEALCAAIQTRLGDRCTGTEECVGVLVAEVCRWWPERHMASLARRKKTPGTAGTVLDALSVVGAKCREEIEARWSVTNNNAAALDILLQAVVVEFSNLWFSSVDQRIALRAVITRVRTLTR